MAPTIEASDADLAALKRERDHYLRTGQDERAAQVADQLKARGGKVEQAVSKASETSSSKAKPRKSRKAAAASETSDD